jgi:tight adherence protein B
MNILMPLVSSSLVFVTVILCIQSLGQVWDSITKHYVADLTKSLEALSIDRSRIPLFLRWWGLSILFVCVTLGIFLGMPPLALGAGYLLYVAPRLILHALIERRKTKLRDQMVSATVALANGCRAGLSLAQALETVARETPEPLAAELKQIVTEYECGRPLPEAIADTKERLNLDSFTLFAMAMLVAIERGGQLTDSLDRISHSLQETQRLERKLAAETASGRNVVMLLTGFPMFFLAFLFLTKPTETMMVFQSLFGQCIMLLVMVLVYASVRWSQKILNIGL